MPTRYNFQKFKEFFKMKEEIRVVIGVVVGTKREIYFFHCGFFIEATKILNTKILDMQGQGSFATFYTETECLK